MRWRTYGEEGELTKMRKTCEREGSRMVGRTLHKYAWCERQRREGGSEVRVKQRERERLH